ncbi:MAG TPA: hypothetical protein VGI10_09850 [Polyangiaceae bacterium]
MIADEGDSVTRACAALAAFGAPPTIVEGLRRALHDEVVWFGVPPARIDVDRDQDRVDVARLERVLYSRQKPAP